MVARRWILVALASLSSLVAGVLSIAPVASAEESCPNAASRQGLSIALPDCRAYELVSPLDKNGSDIGSSGDHGARASVDGDRASFIATAGFADTGGSGALGGTTYVASRGPSGWSSHAVTPASPPTSYQEVVKATFMLGFSSDLRFGFVYGDQLLGADLGTGSANLYREDLASRGLETATLNTSGKPLPCAVAFCWFAVATGYASDDVGVVTFQTADDMIPEATGGAMKLYAWEHGVLRVAGVLPDGTLPAGGSQSVGGSGGPERPGPVAANESVSNDGSRILFYSPADGSSQPQLYMRKGGASTVWLSRSWMSPPSAEPEGVSFQAASPDETKVLFTSRTPLLGSDPNDAEVGLYLYTDTTENAESEAKLSFIARLNGGSVTGMSEDASHIYIANPTPSPGLPESGEYLWDNGTLHHILNTAIPHVGVGYYSKQADEVRVSADGRRLGFLRAASQETEPELVKPAPGQDSGSNPASPGYGYQAAYLYDEGTGKVTCVSCPPSGAPMSARVFIVSEILLHGFLAHGFPFAPRWLSNDGRFVFFSSKDALVPQDTNALADVYEYDADTREVKLLSSGTGENGSWFEDASANGSDVFFLTQQKLTGWDTDTLTDLYDVRADGGLPEPPPPAVPCVGDACQGIPSAVPSFNTASGFAGLGNQPSGSTVKAKKKSKPKKPRKRSRRKRAKRGHKARRSARQMSSRAGR